MQLIEQLELSDNNIIILPKEISNLKKLVRLDIRDNKLKKLPIEICQLSSLKELILWDNELTEIPECIFYMKNLETLFIALGNKIPEAQIEKLKKILPDVWIK